MTIPAMWLGFAIVAGIAIMCGLLILLGDAEYNDDPTEWREWLP